MNALMFEATKEATAGLHAFYNKLDPNGTWSRRFGRLGHLFKVMWLALLSENADKPLANSDTKSLRQTKSLSSLQLRVLLSTGA